MHPDRTNVDDLVRRHLPSASAEDMESDAARVLQRLRTLAAQGIESAEDDRLFDLEPASASRWRWIGVAAAAAVLLAAVATTVEWRRPGRLAPVESADGTLCSAGEGRAMGLGARP